MSTASPELSRELAEWRERVESIAPTLRAHSAESVELRTLAPESVAALDQIEAFKLSGPREVGGLDAHPTTQLEAFTDLSRADISAGWCTMVQSMVAGLAGAHLQEGAVFDAAFGNGYPRFSGTANPEGTARPVDGGWLINGRWSYASGIRHCGWTLAGVKLLDEHGQVRLGANGRPLDTAMAIPTDLVEIEDSWHVTGLSGTGSPHYHAEDLFLPADHRMPFGGVEPRRGGPWFNIPMTTFLVVGVTASCIGLAEHALELFQDYAGRTRFSMGKALGTRTTIRHDYSVAGAWDCGGAGLCRRCADRRLGTASARRADHPRRRVAHPRDGLVGRRPMPRRRPLRLASARRVRQLRRPPHGPPAPRHASRLQPRDRLGDQLRTRRCTAFSAGLGTAMSRTSPERQQERSDWYRYEVDQHRMEHSAVRGVRRV